MRKHEGKREETIGGRCRPWPSGHGKLRDSDVMLRPRAQKGEAALASQRGSSTDEQRATQGGKGGKRSSSVRPKEPEAADKRTRPAWAAGASLCGAAK